MGLPTFSLKRPNAQEVLAFDLVNWLAANETIISVTCATTIKSGIDAGVAAMVIGSANIFGTKVAQKIGAGVDGNYYYVTFTVTTNTQTFEVVGVLFVTTNGV